MDIQHKRDPGTVPEIKTRFIQCPRCQVKSTLPNWRVRHQSGQLVEIACPKCGWEPIGEMLMLFRGALAVQDMLHDLRKRKGSNTD